MNKIRDIDIRNHLKKTELKCYFDDGFSKVIDELGILWGEVIVDIAVVNGSLSSYEIKSQADDLSRLKKQACEYNKVFDYNNIVLHEKHLKNLKNEYSQEIENWGIYVINGDRENIEIEKIKPANRNTIVDMYSICYLLWKDEAISILKKHNITKSLSNKTKKSLYEMLCSNIDEDTLKKEINLTLKSRKEWRVG